MLAQIDVRAGPCDVAPLGISIGCAIFAMSSTGTSTRSSSGLGARASTIVTGRQDGGGSMPENSSWMSASAAEASGA